MASDSTKKLVSGLLSDVGTSFIGGGGKDGGDGGGIDMSSILNSIKSTPDCIPPCPPSDGGGGGGGGDGGGSRDGWFGQDILAMIRDFTGVVGGLGLLIKHKQRDKRDDFFTPLGVLPRLKKMHEAGPFGDRSTDDRSFYSRLGVPGEVRKSMGELGQKVAGNKKDAITKMAGLGTPAKRLSGLFKSMADDLRLLRDMPFIVMEWGEALIESQRHLAAFNGEIAAAMLQSETARIKRGIESGQRTSGSTRFMVEAIDELKDTVQPILDVMRNFIQYAIGWMAKVLGSLIKMAMWPVEKFGEGIDYIVKWLGLDQSKHTASLVEHWVNTPSGSAPPGKEHGPYNNLPAGLQAKIRLANAISNGVSSGVGSAVLNPSNPANMNKIVNFVGGLF